MAGGNGSGAPKGKRKLRSQLWFDNPDNPGMTALYIERYLNFGLTRGELQSGKPIIGIAQTGSDLSPCNRHHLDLAKRVREGIVAAGGIAFEFPVHPIQETGKRPTATLDRNLAYLGLVELLYGYPLDGVVLTTGCDKTTPACIMAAATVNIPAIVLSGGPMLNGWWRGQRAGSGTVAWKAREEHAAGRITADEFMDAVTSSAPSVGHCNTMGTASTMNALAEALGMSLPGCAAIPAPYRERGQIAYETGKRAVEIVWEDLKPSDIITRKALENVIVANSAIGGSTNAPIHINAIALSVGPMLNGWHKGKRAGSGTIVWEGREKLAMGEIDYEEFMEMAADSAPSVGYCNTMGTASTMNALAEVLGMQLPGSASIPAPYRERGQMAYATGRRIVEMVAEDLKPSDVMTRAAFENAIVVNSALGGSTNAPIHLAAIARHLGVALDNDDWQRLGHDIPLLVNLQPAGAYLGEDFHHAGGLPAVIGEVIRAGKLPQGTARTVSGRTMDDLYAEATITNTDVIRPYGDPLKPAAGFVNLKGNLFDSAIMKTSVISEDFRARYLSNPDDPEAFEGRAVVFEGPEDYHARIEDPALGIDAGSILVIRGAGPIGYPGGAEVVNMQPPAALLKQGIDALPCIGDGRQSGTSGSPSILNAAPEAAASGGLALVRTGDRLRIDLAAGTADILVSDAEIATRREALAAAGGFPYPEDQTPWQEIQRGMVDQFDKGMTLKPAVKYRSIAKTKGIPRDNH